MPVVLGLAILSVGCGGSAGGRNQPSPPPAQQITIIATGAWSVANNAPVVDSGNNWVVAGTPSFLLLLGGKGFTASSTVEWNGSALTTTYSSSTNLAAEVPASLVAAPGTAQVTVYDPSESVTSNAIAFGIASPAAATAGVVQLITIAPDGTPANDDSLVQPSISTTGRFVAFQSAATNLTPGPASGYQEIYERDTCIGAPAGCTPSTNRITVTYDGSAVNGHSRDSAISGDGRYVSFDSSATNILNIPDIANFCSPTESSCTYLRDTCIGAPSGCTPSTILVSTTLSGSPANGGNPAMDLSGRFIAFDSSGQAPGVGNVLVFDTCKGVSTGCAPSTSLISESTAGAEGDQNSVPSSINATGRYVAFGSYADNLGGTNKSGAQGAFLRDTCRGASGVCAPSTIEVDETQDGMQPQRGLSVGIGPSISGDGRIVAFASDAVNMVTPNLNITGAIFVRDTCNGAPSGCSPATSLVSLDNDGSIPNATQNNESMSADGRFIAFASLASNLVPGDTFTANYWKDVFVRDTCFGAPTGCLPTTVRVSVTNTPGFATQSNAVSDYPLISGDGHYVAFMSSATNLAPGVVGNGHTMVFLALTGF